MRKEANEVAIAMYYFNERKTEFEEIYKVIDGILAVLAYKHKCEAAMILLKKLRSPHDYLSQTLIRMEDAINKLHNVRDIYESLASPGLIVQPMVFQDVPDCRSNIFG